MTRRELEAALRKGGIEEAANEALLLFSHLSGLSPARLLAEPSLSVDGTAVEALLSRRLSREPLQYILGEAPFGNEISTVSPDCLIPRFDTERLVEAAAERIPKKAHIADLCTGSGCIAISLLCLRKDLTADAYDISEGALRIAEENAKKNGVIDRISFKKADLLSLPTLPRIYGAILSNPPYIPTKDLASLSAEVQKEPLLALDGGCDGLVFYKHFVTSFRTSLAKNGLFLFEIGFDQGNALREIANAAAMNCDIIKDYGGCDRVAILM